MSGAFLENALSLELLEQFLSANLAEEIVFLEFLSVEVRFDFICLSSGSRV